MQVIVSCQRVEAKGGSAVKADCLPLTGFGATEAAAIADLERGLLIWCRGLQRQGLLDAAVGRAGLSTEQDGRPDLRVSVRLPEGEA